MKTTPTKGDKAVAENVISGKSKGRIDLGIVVKINKSKKTFTTEKDGVKVERNYTFGATNGVRLIGFKAPVKEEVAEEEE